MKNLIVVFISFMIATSAIADLSPEELDDAFTNWKLEPVEVDLEREKKLESQFSTWDGSHRKLEHYIKNKLNDPGSYKHVETRYSPDLTPMEVSVRFRAKNVYGGYVTSDVLAEVSDEGEVLRIVKWR